MLSYFFMSDVTLSFGTHARPASPTFKLTNTQQASLTVHTRALINAAKKGSDVQLLSTSSPKKHKKRKHLRWERNFDSN